MATNNLLFNSAKQLVLNTGISKIASSDISDYRFILPEPRRLDLTQGQSDLFEVKPSPTIGVLT
jgi:hypothetical protein